MYIMDQTWKVVCSEDQKQQNVFDEIVYSFEISWGYSYDQSLEFIPRFDKLVGCNGGKIWWRDIGFMAFGHFFGFLGDI